MTIKKLADKEITIDTQSIMVKITHLDSFKVSVGESLIDKPGEYEINNISITTLEIPEPDYVMVNDFVAIHSEGIDVACIFSDKGTNKEFLKDIANIDVLVISSDIDTENVKRMMVLFGPQYLVVIGKKDVEELKKELVLPTFREEKSLKIKDSDFSRGENIVVTPILLK